MENNVKVLHIEKTWKSLYLSASVDNESGANEVQVLRARVEGETLVLNVRGVFDLTPLFGAAPSTAVSLTLTKEMAAALADYLTEFVKEQENE